MYDNTAASTTLFEARSGTLRLNDRNRHTRGDTRCPLCNLEYKDLEHFLLMCDSLKSTRMKIVGLQRPHYEDPMEWHSCKGRFQSVQIRSEIT